MKTIRSTPQPRNDSGDRRRHAPDRRIDQRLSAVLRSADGRSREEIADPLGVAPRPVGQGLRIVRDKGRERLCTVHDQGDPGRLRPARVGRLKQGIATGAFPNAERVRTRVLDTGGVADSIAGITDLLRRIGASSPTVSGSFRKADVATQKRWVRTYRRHTREAGPETRRYFGDACHPVRGVDLLSSCRLLVGQRVPVGVGHGRKRLNVLGADSPDDHDSGGLRATKENITGERFVKRLEALRAKHPDPGKSLLSLDNAKDDSKPCVKGWLAAHRESRLVPLPASSPDRNPIERLWKFLRKKALHRRHKTFEAMRDAVAGVPDHRGDDRDALATLMTERLAIAEVEVAEAVACGRESARSTRRGPGSRRPQGQSVPPPGKDRRDSL